MDTVVRWETALTGDDHDALGVLLRSAFAAQADEFAGRSWPASYARKEARIWLADEAGRPVAHLGLERRTVGVDGRDVLVAGVGDVAVDPARQGQGLGALLMQALDEQLRGQRGLFAADFGFVQCAEPVAGFYRSTGWSPVSNLVRLVAIADQRSVREGHWPTLIRPGRRALDEWPDGLVDLRGLPW